MKPYIIILLAILASPEVFAEKTLQECIDTDNDLERLVCYDTIFGHSKGSSSRELSASSEDSFGSERLKKPSKSQDTLESKIVGEVNNLTKGDKFSLTNGQIWIVTESSTLRYKAKSPNIIISKGFMGSYFLEFPNLNRRIKVKRVK